MIIFPIYHSLLEGTPKKNGKKITPSGVRRARRTADVPAGRMWPAD